LASPSSQKLTSRIAGADLQSVPFARLQSMPSARLQSMPALVKRLLFLIFPQISQISADDKIVSAKISEISGKFYCFNLSFSFFVDTADL
jgi:hypothetical protein